MKKRTLGNTGFEVTELGYGSWPLCNNRNMEYGEIDEKEAHETVETYLNLGGNFIDTARGYGERPERVIGTVVKEKFNREDVYIATKSAAGQNVDSIPGLRKDLEESLRLLKTDYVDVFQLHQPPEDKETMNRVLDEMDRFKEEGKIRSLGASIKGPDVSDATVALCHQYIDTGRLGSIQIVYSILRQKLLPVIEKAEQSGVGVIVRTVLESGLLTGKYKPGHTFSGLDQRRRYKADHLEFILKTVEEIGRFAVRPPFENLAETAIRFALEPTGVSTIIVGAHRPENVKRNVKTAELPGLDSEVLEKLRKEYGDITEKANYQ